MFSGPEDVPLLRARLDSLQAVWELQHAPRGKAVSYGLWPKGANRVEILFKRGKGWQAFGQHTGSRTLLLPEEALYLMESDRLVCLPAISSGAPLTLHAGYAAAMATGLTSAHYSAFAHLCRMGFVVRRCDEPWFLDRKGWAYAAQEEARLEREEEPAAPGATEPVLPPVADEGDDAPWVNPGWGEQAVAPMAGVEQPVQSDALEPPPAAAAGDAPCRTWWPAEAAPAYVAPLAPLPVVEEAVAPAALPPPHAALPAGPAEDAPRVVYDVWPPRANFNKRTTGKPQFRLCITSVRPPAPAELAVMSAASAPVPVKSVIVRPGMFIGFDINLSATMHHEMN